MCVRSGAEVQALTRLALAQLELTPPQLLHCRNPAAWLLVPLVVVEPVISRRPDLL